MSDGASGRGAELLERDWWVFDNALALGHRLGRGKGREVLLLRHIKGRYRRFPEGTVFANEAPDFVIRAECGRRVGIEITELLRGGRRGGGSPHRARWEAEEKVKRRAAALHHLGLDGDPRAAPPVRVHLGWPPAPECPEKLPGGVEGTAAAIARLVREAEPEWRGGEQVRMGPKRLAGTPLEGVLLSLEVRLDPHPVAGDRTAAWTASRSNSLWSAGESYVLRAIASKDGTYERCREACDEAWLVVALVGGADSYQTFDEGVLSRPFPSPFDRLLLLCTEGGPDLQTVYELHGHRRW